MNDLEQASEIWYGGKLCTGLHIKYDILFHNEVYGIMRIYAIETASIIVT